jgi:hypothetical protein
MMPFIFGDKESLPDNLRCYFPLIEQCPYMADEIGKVGFLTVHESYVVAGESQRRSGLHIEAPGTQSSFHPGIEHAWGIGHFYGPDRYDGGIFFASSVANTSMVWNALVDKNVPGIVDKHGSCEHLRSIIGEGTKLDAGELIWMTDCTPHEALLQTESGYRQFFRVVTSSVSHWFAAHSTNNPKVPLPPNIVVVQSNKFDQDASCQHVFGPRRVGLAPPSPKSSAVSSNIVAIRSDEIDQGIGKQMPPSNSPAVPARSRVSLSCDSVRKTNSTLLVPSFETETIVGQPQVEEVLKDTAPSDEEIASLSASEDLPPGWVSSTDIESGKTYYFNDEIGMSSWEKPL